MTQIPFTVMYIMQMRQTTKHSSKNKLDAAYSSKCTSNWSEAVPSLVNFNIISIPFELFVLTNVIVVRVF